MFTDPVQFYFVKLGAHGPLAGDLAKITEQLGTYADDGIHLKRDASSLLISYTESPMRATLSIKAGSKLKDVVVSNQMILTCERADNTSVNLLRNIIRNMGYRVYNPEMGAYNSQDPDLLDLTTIKIDERTRAIIDQNGFKPLFNYRNNLVYFAQKKGGKAIYQINSDLLLHLIEKGPAKFAKTDFAVEVASDLGHFIALYDRGMIQGSFYNKFKKIFNYSDLEIIKLKRDVFVRPVYFKYNEEKQSFEQFNGHSEKRDIVKKGKNLYRYPQSALSELKVKNKFLSAKIQRSIDYEENEKGRLIPRLNIIIFVD